VKLTVTFKQKVDAKGNMRSVPTYFADGKKVSEKKFNALVESSRPKVKQRKKPVRQAVPRYPLKSASMGVHPSQVADAIADSEKKGVPTHFDARGRAEFRDRNHRRQFAKAYGAVDHDGGYGDG
jgi:hypothetical protein